MVNFREVNEFDILKEWLDYREEAILSCTSPQNKEHKIYFDEIAEHILKNVPTKNKKYVKKQLDRLDVNFIDYLKY